MRIKATVAWLVLAVAAVAVLARGRRHDGFTNGPQAAIAGGRPALAANFPWYCHSRLKLQDGLFPGVPKTAVLVISGALISPTQILTTQGVATATVPVGSTFMIGGDETRTITDVWIHPFMDLAVVTLDRPSTKKPIRIASQAPPPGTSLTFVGRGGTVRDEGVTIVPQAQPLAPQGQLRKALVTLVGWRGRGAQGKIKSPVGAIGCGSDIGAPVFIPKGEMGRPDDELVGILSGSECFTFDRKPILDRRMWVMNAAYYQRTLPQAKAYADKLKACRGQFADAAPWFKEGTYELQAGCPKSAPWDTGLMEMPGKEWCTYGMCTPSWHLMKYPCLKTKACADVVYDMMSTMVDPATPRVKNNPVPDSAANTKQGATRRAFPPLF